MPPIAQLIDDQGQETILSAQAHHSEAPGRFGDSATEAPFHVCVTGFGPFHEIRVNPSWQAIKALHGRVMSRKDGRLARIVCAEIPVVYEAVLDTIPKAHGLDHSHSQPQYDCFVHVGVSPSRSYVSLEKRARRCGYDKRDVAGQACRSAIDERQKELVYGLVGPEWDSTGQEPELVCSLNLEEIASRLRSARLVDAQISTNAGLFLCEFTYYTSLASAQRKAIETRQTAKPVLFVHVPNVNSPADIAHLTQIIAHIVSQIVEKL